MQMYDNDYNEEGQDNERERRERRKKKHRKARDENFNDEEIVNRNRTEEFENTQNIPGTTRRRSEEENYEPVNETRRKHRHRRSRTDETELKDEGGEVGIDDDQRAIEEQEKARRLRREKKRRANERKKSQEEQSQNIQSPISDINDYQEETAEPYYGENEEVQYEEQEDVSLNLEDEVASQPPEVQEKTKKKIGPFGRIFASFKKRGKNSKNEAPINDHWQSNPEIFNPAYDSRPSTLEQSKKKIQSKSSRNTPIRKVHVILLDGEEVELEIDQKATGGQLFDQVCQDIDLIEKDFFGMTFVIAKLQTWFWLEMDKKIAKQLGKDDEWTFNFQVKFYPPEPVLLQEDLTRYLLCLQVRQDVYTGKLPCSWITQALLGSFMVQSELGDYDELENDGSIDYLREFEFVLNQSDQLLEKICELHKKHVGLSPDRADVKYMETAKRLEQYGVDLHPARDNDDVEIFIGISYQGILIYRDRLRIGRFAWPKVLRISYKKNYFYLKIRSDRYDDSVAIVGFKLFNHYLAKRLWRNAAEQHTFFRMKEPQIGKVVSRLAPSSNSNATYAGKTLHQYRTLSINRVQPAHFDRSLTKRKTIGSMPAGLNRAGMQYSSMHSLNRMHPRDMTLGKTKSVEYLTSKRPGSSIGVPYDREGSLGSLTQPRMIQPPAFPPYVSVNSYKDDDRHQSFRSGDSLNGGDSYTVNHDDQMSLPSMSPKNHHEYSKPVKKLRSKIPSNDVHSDDGIISPLPYDRIGIRLNKMAPLPLPPNPQSSDSEATESIQKPPLRKPQQKQLPLVVTNNSHNRSQPQFKAPPPPPDPIPEPPSISSSVQLSQMDNNMPPPPPVDLNSYTDTDRVIHNKIGITAKDRPKPPPVKPKPVIKPKPQMVINGHPVVTKSSSRRQVDEML